MIPCYDVPAPRGATKVERILSKNVGVLTKNTNTHCRVLVLLWNKGVILLWYNNSESMWVGGGLITITWKQKCQPLWCKRQLRWQWPGWQPPCLHDLWLFAIFPCSSKHYLGHGNRNVRYFRMTIVVIWTLEPNRGQVFISELYLPLFTSAFPSLYSLSPSLCLQCSTEDLSSCL